MDVVNKIRKEKNQAIGLSIFFFDEEDFWRTTQQQEIDLIEEVENEMTAYELKWS